MSALEIARSNSHRRSHSTVCALVGVLVSMGSTGLAWARAPQHGPRRIAPPTVEASPGSLGLLDGASPREEIGVGDEHLTSGQLEPSASPPTISELDEVSSQIQESSRDTNCSIWLVNTRKLNHGCCSCPFEPVVQRYDCQSGWTNSSLEEFFATDDVGTVTTIFVHGNDTSARDAIETGQEVRRKLARDPCSGKCARFVIWSWPSDRVPGRLRKDGIIKAARTSPEGLMLARFLDRMQPNVPVSLVGFSFGARIITGALHVLAGGRLSAGALTTREHAERSATRAVLIAAALDNDWLTPGHEHELALSQVDRLLVFVNPQDLVLGLYPRITDGRNEALGYTGLVARRRVGEQAAKVHEVNVNHLVGRQHAFKAYLEINPVVARMRREALFLDE